MVLCNASFRGQKVDFFIRTKKSSLHQCTLAIGRISDRSKEELPHDPVNAQHALCCGVEVTCSRDLRKVLNPRNRVIANMAITKSCGVQFFGWSSFHFVVRPDIQTISMETIWWIIIGSVFVISSCVRWSSEMHRAVDPKLSLSLARNSNARGKLIDLNPFRASGNDDRNRYLSGGGIKPRVRGVGTYTIYQIFSTMRDISHNITYSVVNPNRVILSHNTSISKVFRCAWCFWNKPRNGNTSRSIATMSLWRIICRHSVQCSAHNGRRYGGR
jgi:hypothetical protein